MTLAGPPSAEAGSSVRLSSNLASTDGLRFHWDFGDGSSSAEPSPVHSYRRAGEFEYRLKVSDSWGQSAEASGQIRVTSLANVAGLLCTKDDSRGWCWQQQQPSSHRKFAVAMLAPTHLVSVGEFGEILRSDDAGLSWERQASGTSKELRVLAFKGEQLGWTAGRDGAVLRTLDGGASWQQRPLHNAGDWVPQSLHLVDADTVVLFGNEGLRATSDGGSHWHEPRFRPIAITPAGRFWVAEDDGLSLSEDLGASRRRVLQLAGPGISQIRLSAIAVDEQRVRVLVSYFVGSFPERPTLVAQRLWRSDDAGSTWTDTDVGAQIGLGAVMLSANEHEIFASNQQLWRSVNNGASWQVVPATPFTQADKLISITPDQLFVIAAGVPYTSMNGGQSWLRSEMPVGVGSLGMPTLQQTGDAVSLLLPESNGLTLFSRDGGRSFQRVAGHTNIELNLQYAPWFFDAKRGLLLAFDRSLKATDDGGRTWTALAEGLDGGSGRQRLQFVNQQHGWMLLSTGQLKRSVDGGLNWLPLSAASDIADFHFASATLGLARTTGVPSQFKLSRDGGDSWQPLAAPAGAQVVAALGDERFVAAGHHGLLARSSDGGVSWIRQSWGDGQEHFLRLVNQRGSIWALGSAGTLLRSDDGGASWQAIATGVTNALNDLSFGSDQTAWLVGDGGLILMTSDGGRSWSRQPSGTGLTLHHVQAVDEQTAWISGDQASLLATASGGL